MAEKGWLHKLKLEGIFKALVDTQSFTLFTGRIYSKPPEVVVDERWFADLEFL